MQLIDNWKAVAVKAWSMRFIALSVLLSALEAVLPYLDYLFPRGVFAVLAGVVSVGAAVSRLMAQPGLHA
jgi:hypothetical protein